jgi:hypothetical protein
MKDVDFLAFKLPRVQIYSLIVFFTLSLYASGFSDITPFMLFDFEDDFNLKEIETTNLSVKFVTTETGHALRVKTNPNKDLPSIFLKAPEGHWDLSRYEYIEMDVRNLGNKPVTVWCRVLPKRPRTRHMGTVNLDAGESGTLKLILSRSIVPIRLSEPVEFINMNGAPGQPDRVGDTGDFDQSNIEQISIFVLRSSSDYAFEIDNIRAGGRIVKIMDAEDFFPFVDEFGQFIHEEWPGKVHSVEELIEHREEETEDLALNPGPTNWDKYGGWANGPKLKATGFFRVEKYNGKWWLVDPEGHLFWSHGSCGVRLRGRSGRTTPLTDRMHYFRNLPDDDSPLARFYSEGRAREYPKDKYYAGKVTKNFSFLSANLYRKYGEDYNKQLPEIQFKRLRSWGMNTLGNWSSPGETLKLPYFRYISTGNARVIEGSEGYWRQFPDPFDVSYREGLRENFKREIGGPADDPWLIGYFVDHEQDWEDEVSLSLATLASPPDQPAKKVFISDLKSKYGTIDKLNTAWRTNYASWDALLQSREIPDNLKDIVVHDFSFIGIIKPTHDPNREEIWTDLTDFYTKLSDAYFRISQEELKRVAPNHLYFGSPFASSRNDRAIRAAAKYCDVIGFDLYENPAYIAAFRLPEGCVDKPTCICEWHLGACDRGMFHTSLMGTASQEERAEAYKQYVQNALGHYNFVGTHWFTIGSQEITGRWDGENYNNGFTDVCDTPYEEMIKACREVGYNMYEYRLKGK